MCPRPASTCVLVNIAQQIREVQSRAATSYVLPNVIKDAAEPLHTHTRPLFAETSNACQSITTGIQTQFCQPCCPLDTRARTAHCKDGTPVVVGSVLLEEEGEGG